MFEEQELAKDLINVDFLLPMGILVPLMCDPAHKLEDIKDSLWQKAKEYPLFGHLRYGTHWTLTLTNPDTFGTGELSELKWCPDFRGSSVWGIMGPQIFPVYRES